MQANSHREAAKRFHKLSAEYFQKNMDHFLDKRQFSQHHERKQEEYADKAVAEIKKYHQLQDLSFRYGSSRGEALAARARGELTKNRPTSLTAKQLLDSYSFKGRGAYARKRMIGQGGFFGDVISSIF